MAPYGRPRLRDLFDDAPTPHIAHPPFTHQRDFYLATDGSFTPGESGLGAIIETSDGDRLRRIAHATTTSDNNAAEYRALQLGLDTLATYTSAASYVGILVDHHDLAANVNAAALGMNHPDWPAAITVPETSTGEWRDIRAHIDGFADIRAACIRSDDNPAHVLANAPAEYDYVNDEPPEPPDQGWGIPPPSRAERHADD